MQLKRTVFLLFAILVLAAISIPTNTAADDDEDDDDHDHGCAGSDGWNGLWMGLMMFGGLLVIVLVFFLLFQTTGGHGRFHHCPHCGCHGFNQHPFHHPQPRDAQFDQDRKPPSS